MGIFPKFVRIFILPPPLIKINLYSKGLKWGGKHLCSKRKKIDEFKKTRVITGLGLQCPTPL